MEIVEAKNEELGCSSGGNRAQPELASTLSLAFACMSLVMLFIRLIIQMYHHAFRCPLS